LYTIASFALNSAVCPPIRVVVVTKSSSNFMAIFQLIDRKWRYGY